MSAYRLHTGLPRLLRDLAGLDDAARARRLEDLDRMITGGRIHFPLEADERLTERDRRGGVLDFALRLRRAHAELLGKHQPRHLMIPERDHANVTVIEELEALRMPTPNEPPLVVVLSGPNSTGKSLLGAWLAVRLLGREVKIETASEALSGVIRGGVFGPPPMLKYQGTRLRASYDRQVVVRPPVRDATFIRDPDLLRQIQEGYDDDDAPSERGRINRLAATRVLVIEDLGWRHGGKSDFPRRVWSDFFDRRESASGTVTIISTNLTEPEQMIEHIDMRGWERLGGMVRKSGGWFDVRGRSRRLGGQAA